jgi:hypothetical protein
MPDEHESASAAWLDLPETQREMRIIEARYPSWSSYEVASFVVQVQMLTAFDVYEMPETPPDDDPEPWRRAA